MAKGRTYRYFKGEPLYPFGHGLSYTAFTYYDLQLSHQQKIGQPVDVQVTVQNVGDWAGDEVTQLYLRHLEPSGIGPIHQLAGFARVPLQPGQSQTLCFTLQPEQFSCVTEDGRRFIEPGHYSIMVGGGQPGYSATLSGDIELMGEAVEIPR
jgi:beta-glucosidase